MSNNIRCFLIGTGGMAIEYAKVLKQIGVNPIVIGRGEASARKFETETTIRPFTGGIETYIDNNGEFSQDDYAIVAVGILELYNVAVLLSDHGMTNILLEKPGVFSRREAESLCNKKNVMFYIAYNRRFLASVMRTQELIKADGGIVSVRAEFTEWAGVISKTNHSDEVKQRWFLANSSHVADLCFFLAGKPRTMECFRSGRLDWHDSGSEFVGAGVTENDALFSYCANWSSAGRWGLEICTPRRRIILKPLESLKEQMKDSIVETELLLEDSYDIDFKPGLYREVEAFLLGRDRERLCTLKEQSDMLDVYQKISGEDY